MLSGNELEEIYKAICRLVISFVVFGLAIGFVIGFACLAVYMAVT